MSYPDGITQLYPSGSNVIPDAAVMLCQTHINSTIASQLLQIDTLAAIKQSLHYIY